jgi:hypothetical protein
MAKNWNYPVTFGGSLLQQILIVFQNHSWDTRKSPFMSLSKQGFIMDQNGSILESF